MCNNGVGSGACVVSGLPKQEIWNLVLRWTIYRRIGHFLHTKRLNMWPSIAHATSHNSHVFVRAARRQVVTQTRERSINVARQTVKQYDVASIIDGNPSSLFATSARDLSAPKTRFKRDRCERQSFDSNPQDHYATITLKEQIKSYFTNGKREFEKNQEMFLSIHYCKSINWINSFNDLHTQLKIYIKAM